MFKFAYNAFLILVVDLVILAIIGMYNLDNLTLVERVQFEMMSTDEAILVLIMNGAETVLSIFA